MIPHSRPTLDERDFVSVSEVFKSGQIAQGERVAEFERKLANFVGTKNGVATNSGTSALHLALAALGVKEGDEVIIPSYVCTAPLNAINYLRVTPVLVDIDPHSFNLDVRKLTNCITRKTKVIIVPHLFGLPASPPIAAGGEPLAAVLKKLIRSFGPYKNVRLPHSTLPSRIYGKAS